MPTTCSITNAMRVDALQCGTALSSSVVSCSRSHVCRHAAEDPQKFQPSHVRGLDRISSLTRLQCLAAEWVLR